MPAILLAFGAFLSTLCGGLFAIRFRNKLHFILSFAAGVLLGVVTFDILPELYQLANTHGVDPMRGMIALIAGFLAFHSLEKFLLLHQAHESNYASHYHPRVGVFSALALSGHSFMDGVGIGLAFQVSNTVGIAVAVAVISHDFCDGLNTASLMLLHQNSRKRSFAMLLLDAVAPILGVLSTLAFSVPPGFLVIYLGFFAGFLLYIGAADILPEAHSIAGPAKAAGLIALTCLGAATIYTVIRVAG